MSDSLDSLQTGSKDRTLIVNKETDTVETYDTASGRQILKSLQAKGMSLPTAIAQGTFVCTQNYFAFYLHILTLSVAFAVSYDVKNGPLEAVLAAFIKIHDAEKGIFLLAFIAKFMVMVVTFMIYYKRFLVVTSLIWIPYLYKPSKKMAQICGISTVIGILFYSKTYTAILIYHLFLFLFSQLADPVHKSMIAVCFFLYNFGPYVFSGLSDAVGPSNYSTTILGD